MSIKNINGEIKEAGVLEFLKKLYVDSFNGKVIFTISNNKKTFYMANGNLIFSTSNKREDSFGYFLLSRKLITKDAFNLASDYMKKYKKRFGRSLVEMGYLDYGTMYYNLIDHIKEIFFSVLFLEEVKYEIEAKHIDLNENYRINDPLPRVITEGLRKTKLSGFIKLKLRNVNKLYINNLNNLDLLGIKDYEVHLIELVRKFKKLSVIVSNSELSELDTLKIIYSLLLFDVVSIRDTKELKDEDIVYNNLTGFNSFEDAINHFNQKYIEVYKILSKEIGPVAKSILLKAVEEIRENLPPYFSDITLVDNGGINSEKILKTVWYYDFNKYIKEFISSLEEILYAEIFAIKKNLGPEYEQQIIKWLK